MAQHTGSLLCHGAQTLSTAGLIGPPHWLLLVGLLLVLPREGTYPALPCHPCFFCLGWFCHWHLWPHQERAESWQRALLMQDQKHKAMQCLWHCQICKGLWEGQHHHEDLWGPPEWDVPHWRFSLRGIWPCQTIEPCHGWTQAREPYADPRQSYEEAGMYGTHQMVWCLHWWVPHTHTLCKMYTLEELRTASIVTAMSTSANPVTSGQPAGSEFEESNITNTEGLHDMVEESMDMEMAQQTHVTLMITSKAWRASPSSSATMAPPPSSSATLVPTKKKISIQEYNRCKAAEQQRASTYLNRDENGEDLDYEDFEPQDDPANFQSSYRTPMPIPQIFDLPHCKMPQPQCPNQPPPPWPPMLLFQCPKPALAEAPFQAWQCTMLPPQLTKPLASAGYCQWPELHPCRSEPWQLHLDLCKLVHWWPRHAGQLDMGSLQRKHFFRGLPYHALPIKRLIFWTHG